MVYLSCMKKLIIMAVIFTACQSKEDRIKEAVETANAIEANNVKQQLDAEQMIVDLEERSKARRDSAFRADSIEYVNSKKH